MPASKRRNKKSGGPQSISLSGRVLKKALLAVPLLNNLYITDIGYISKAPLHSRIRRSGCSDNIFLYCLRGKGWYAFEGKYIEVCAGEFIRIPATKDPLRYGADREDPWTLYWVHFNGRDMKAFNLGFGINHYDRPRPIAVNEKGLQIWHTMYRSLETGYKTENLCKASLHLYGFLASFLFADALSPKEKTGPSDIITGTVHYMRGALHKKLSVKDMADQHHLSISRFSARFCKGTGLPPLTYFIHLKLQKACQLLNSKNISIQDIARQLGYEDAHYFSRSFVRVMGYSPTEYRKRY